MERELQSVNRSLHAHPFHNERYSFHRTTVADFQPILKIIEIGKTSPEALDMLFRGDVPDNFPHRDTIVALEALLEDPEKDFSQFEDYRNFYTFEIHMQDVATGRTTRWETRRGTGSGAEQQVPIYVAIGASLASVYGSAERRHDKPSGISLAIFDEAFSKMDGKNQRQMMSFYKDLGLQIIIAAPFEKRVAVLEHMETIVEIDRIGEQSRASVVRLKERATAGADGDRSRSHVGRRPRRPHGGGVATPFGHGNRPTCSSPVVSGKPSIRFMFCTAWPDAPLVRLSSAEQMMARPSMRSLVSPMKVKLRAAHVAGLRHLPEGQHVHERLVRVGLRKDRVKVLRRLLDPAHINGRQDPAVHGHEVGREADDHLAAGGEREFLVELGHVAVAADAVGVEAFRHFGEQHLLLGRPARPGHAGLGIDHDLVGIDRLAL